MFLEISLALEIYHACFSSISIKKNLRYDKRKENSNSTILENTIRELHDLVLATLFPSTCIVFLVFPSRRPRNEYPNLQLRASSLAVTNLINCCWRCPLQGPMPRSQKIENLRLLCIDRFISIYPLVSFFLIFQIPTLGNEHPNLTLRQQSSLHKFD